MMKKLQMIGILLTVLLFATFSNAGPVLTCDPQEGVTHYEVTWTSEDPEVVSVSTANLDGSMEHDVSWLPPSLHTGYIKAGKEWLIREGTAADQLGSWVSQNAYTWSAPTYFEIDGGTPQPSTGVTASDVR